MKLTKGRRPYERVRLRGRRRKWNGKGAGGRGGGEIKAGRLGRKGKGSFSLFSLTLFPATPPPPLLSLAFILLSRDYEIVF